MKTNVIYKINLNERVSPPEFPNLKNEFKSEIVQRAMVNENAELCKWRMNNKEEGIVYTVGYIKE